MLIGIAAMAGEGPRFIGAHYSGHCFPQGVRERGNFLKVNEKEFEKKKSHDLLFYVQLLT